MLASNLIRTMPAAKPVKLAAPAVKSTAARIRHQLIGGAFMAAVLVSLLHLVA